MEIPVIFENERYVIVDKPAGLVVHSDGKTAEPALTDWIAEKYPQTLEVGEPLTLSSGEVIKRPGIVHRIDRETSGALVIAKNAEAFAHLKELFKTKRVEKTYHAFVYGTVKKDEDTINRPIGRSRKDFRMWSAQRFARGELREAITDYKVLARGGGEGKEGAAAAAAPQPNAPATTFTFIEVKPRTGRTHQIRVHFKAINHPVVADKLYAPKHKALLGFKRLALHARSIQFVDLDGKTIVAEASYPADFSHAVASLSF